MTIGIVSRKLAVEPLHTSLALVRPRHPQSRPPSNLGPAPSRSVASLWPGRAKKPAPVHKSEPLGCGECGNLVAKTGTGVHCPVGADQQWWLRPPAMTVP